MRINREIWSLAVPNILSNISIPLLSSVDTALMGGLSSTHLAAVGVSSVVFSFMYWNFGFLRMGTTGIVAQAFGKLDSQSLRVTLWRAVSLALVVAILLVVGQDLLYFLSQRLLAIDGDIAPLYREYFVIRIWAAPATLSLFALFGWFFGVQNAAVPLVVTVLGNLTNILVSWYLVQECDMGVSGVAWGTVGAQYLSLILAVGFVHFSRYRVFQLSALHGFWDWQEVRRFLVVNRDIFVRTLILTASFGLFYRISSGLGQLILAANVVLMQFVNWISYGLDGFAYAAESLVGKYYGSRDYVSIRRVIGRLFFWSFLIAGVYAGGFYLFYADLTALFTDDSLVLKAVGQYSLWIVLIPILANASYIWDGVYIGLTASQHMRNAMAIAALVYVALLFGFRSWGNHGLWLAFCSFLFARGAIQTGWYRYVIRRRFADLVP